MTEELENKVEEEETQEMDEMVAMAEESQHQVQNSYNPPASYSKTENDNKMTQYSQTAKDVNNSKKEKVDLHSLSSENAEKCYAYALKLVEKGHKTLATEVLKHSLENAYASSCVAGAVSREGFAVNLENGYYSTCKLFELFNIIAAMGIKQEKHDELSDSIMKMQKMYAASIRTVQKRIIVPQNGGGF